MAISFSGGSTSSGKSLTINSFVINSSGHLIVTYSDNTIVDLGLVVGQNGADGRNFYPDEIGFEIPDGSFEIDKDIGYCYLSLAADPVSLYFKLNDSTELVAQWKAAPFGTGATGATGRPFQIDSSGTTKPTDPAVLFDEYIFFDTTLGAIWIYDLDTTTWEGPYQFTGPTGPRGMFKIDSQGDVLPDIDTLDVGYTFYDTDTGALYYVTEDSNGQKSWSDDIAFRGPKGNTGDQGIQGNPGSDANNIYAIKNIIDTSYENAVLVIGTVPAGYLVTRIEVTVDVAYDLEVNSLKVRFGGTAQSMIDGTVIAPDDYFDINVARRYIVDEVNHSISNVDEILSCIFEDSVNNSSVGQITIICTLAKQLPITPIEDNI